MQLPAAGKLRLMLCMSAFDQLVIRVQHDRTDAGLRFAALDLQTAEATVSEPLRPPMFANNTGEAAEYCLAQDAFKQWVFLSQVR